MRLQVIHLLHRFFNRVSAPFTKNVKPLPRSLFALLITLVIVPCLLSYYNVRRTAQGYDVCFVGPSSSYGNTSTSAKYQDLYGTYRKIDEDGYYFAKTPFKLSYFCLTKNFMPGRFCGWPSVTTLAHELSAKAMVSWKTANMKSELKSENEVFIYEDDDFQNAVDPLGTKHASNMIEWDGENKIWCINKRGLPPAEQLRETRVCSKTVPTKRVHVAKGSYFEDFPVSNGGPTNGLWDGIADNGGLQVHCYLSGKKEELVRKDGYINTSIDPLRLPATLTLIILQTWLYYRYRHLSTQPESVRLQYDRVFSPHNEWWRVATSAFAHFDKRHLIWDAYNIYSMGAQLEDHYGTIMFLSLNMALVILTSLLTLGVTYIQIKIFRREISNRATHVGYSGVLFALMALASMGMGGLYPIPYNLFAKNFESIPFWKGVREMPINAAILANLVLAKFFIRKASFVSHGVGLIMGWFLYWNIPLREFIMPHVLIPTVLFLQLRFVQKLIPMTRRQGSGEHYEVLTGNNKSDPAATDIHFTTSSTTRAEDIQIETSNSSNDNVIMQMLHILRGAMVGSSVVSIIVLDNGMSASQCNVTLLFHYAVQSFPQNDSTENMKVTDAIMRSYFCSVVILVVVDATTMGAWIVAHVLILDNPHSLFESGTVGIFLAIRLLINLVGMVTSAGILGHGDERVNMYGGIFLNASVVGEKILPTKDDHRFDAASDNEMSSASAV